MSLMRHGPRGMGSYVGEIRQGPEGQLYEWIEGVDGLGNPIGFWKAIKAVGSAVGKAAGAVGRTVGKAAGAVISTVGKAAGTIPRALIRPLCPRIADQIPGFGGFGSGSYIGEIGQDPDGNLYQWEEGLDGLGYPVGFWKTQPERYQAVLEPGMTLCVESYFGPRHGGEGVKLEQQVLVTDSGLEMLSRLPFEEDWI